MDFFSSEEEPPQQKGCCSFLTVEYYQPYFDVTENDVIDRMKASFLPLRPDFQEKVADKPDLWGPIWISATLIFLITAVANINHMNLADTSAYSVAYVPEAAALLYCISFGSPIIITVVMKLLGSDTRLFHTMCLYGYSMSTLLPITVLCIFQYSFFQWTLITYGMISSSTFLIMGMKISLDQLEQSKKYIIVAIILAMQFSLYLIYKLVFFKVIENNSSE